jgi:hypothetical protein
MVPLFRVVSAGLAVSYQRPNHATPTKESVRGLLKIEMRKSHFRYRAAEIAVLCFAQRTGNHRLCLFLGVLLQHPAPEGPAYLQPPVLLVGALLFRARLSNWAHQLL